MKKTLAVAAVLAAFAGSAFADVTVYGKVDMGYLWKNVEGADTLTLGNNGGNQSRIGFKGSEKIGDMTVGFVYETGLDPENPSEKEFNNRQSNIYVKGAFGELGVGYYGVLDASTGSYSITGSGAVSAAGTGWGGDILDQGWVIKTNGRMSNAVTYVSPAMAGLTAYAQVASGTDATYGEYNDDVNMFYGVGAKYQAGNFGAVLTVTSTEVGKAGAGRSATTVEDLNVVAGVNYNFGAFTAYLGANYYDTGVEGKDNYGVVASAKAAVAGGTAYVSAGYGEVGDNKAGDETKMYFGVGDQYPLSKATFLYAGANWKQSDKSEVKNATTGKFGEEVNTTEVAFGMVHSF